MRNFVYFGYIENDETDTLVQLDSVTLCLDSDQARSLSRFLLDCAEGMESNKAWEHEHFPDDLNLVVSANKY